MKQKIIKKRKYLLSFSALVVGLLFLQMVAPATWFGNNYSRVEAATSAENKVTQKAQDYCDNISPDATEYHDACEGKYKAYYLGDPPGPECPTGDDTNYQWCASAAKAGKDQAAKDFPNFEGICSAFISNAKGGNWPNFSDLSGAEKQKAISACNKGLGQGYASAPGRYPSTSTCDPGNATNKEMLIQACYAGRSLADAHIFTPGEASAIARSGNLPRTDNSNDQGGGAGGGAGGGQGGNQESVICEEEGGDLGWILCPAYDIIQGVATWILNELISPLLYTNPLCLDTTGTSCNDTIYRIWSAFRIYGNIFLVIALLIIVFGESIGGGLIDAYTAKKILPRLLIAAVLINLSIYIVALLIDITNVIGGGIGQLLTAPLRGQGAFEITPTGITPAAAAGAGFLGLTAGGLALGFTGGALLLLGLVVTGIIAIVGVFITLILRQVIIIGLVLVSPVAFALWCVPNTAQWFKRWWDLLFQMLLVYPIIVAIFAIASILSAITSESTGGGNALATVISFLLLVIPLYLIPFVLRSSNRILGAVHGAVSSVGKQINAVTGRRALSGAGAQVGKNWEATKAGNRFRGGTEFNRRGRINRFLQGASMSTPENVGFNPRRMRSRLAAARSARTSAISAEAEKDLAVRAIIGNDDLLAASLHGTGSEADSRAYLQGLGQRGAELEQNVASIRQARRSLGSANFEDFAAANLAGTGTGYRGGPAEMFQTINRVAGDDRARATRILNSARGQAERAKRIDLAGSGFATSADALSQLYSGQTTAAAVNERVTDEVLNVKSGGEIGTARNNALINMVGAIQRRMANAQAAVANAQAAGNAAAIAHANHEYKRIVAHTSSFLDAAGSASPENAQVVGAIMGQQMANGSTLGQEIRVLEPDPEFQQYKKVYGSAAPGAPGGPPPAGGALPAAPAPPPPPPPAAGGAPPV